MDFPTVTKLTHNAPYPSISPTRPELSVAGKTILITGGSAGVGANVAEAFAQAGSKKIALLGRTLKTLESTAASLKAAHTALEILTLVADITDKAAVDAAFAKTKATFGHIDVLISNAAYLPDILLIKDCPVDEWWSGMEINVKGSLILAQALLANLDTSIEKETVVVDVSSPPAHLPPWPKLSSYAVSKVAALKLWDYVAAESENKVRVIHVAPGVVKTNMNKKATASGMEFPYDDRKCA